MKNSGIVFIFLFLSMSLFSVTEIKIELKDTKTEWNVGLTSLYSKNLQPQNKYLAKNVPLKIHQKIIEHTNHILNDNEIKAYAKQIVKDQTVKIKNQISTYDKDLSMLDFNTYSTSIKNEKLDRQKDLYEKIAIEYKKLDFLKNFDYRKIPINKNKPIKFVNTVSDTLDIVFFEPIQEKFDIFSKDKKIDLLITGSVEELAGYIYYEILIYNSVVNDIVLKIVGGGSATAIMDQLDTKVDDIITVLIGREWASLTVNVTPITASIKVSEKYFGTGIYRNSTIEPNKYTMIIDAPGYVGEEHEIEIKPNEKKVIDIALIKNPISPVLITTFPSNADFYLSSMWLGKTPILVETAGVNEPFLIRKNGFIDYIDVFDITNFQLNSSYNFEIVMKTSIINIDPYVKDRRAAFYSNLSGLAFAIPITLLAIGFVERFSSSYPNGVDATRVGQHKVLTTVGALNSIFAAGIVLDIIFATGLIIDSINYIKVYDTK